MSTDEPAPPAEAGEYVVTVTRPSEVGDNIDTEGESTTPTRGAGSATVRASKLLLAAMTALLLTVMLALAVLLYVLVRRDVSAEDAVDQAKASRSELACRAPSQVQLEVANARITKQKAKRDTAFDLYVQTLVERGDVAAAKAVLDAENHALALLDTPLDTAINARLAAILTCRSLTPPVESPKGTTP